MKFLRLMSLLGFLGHLLPAVLGIIRNPSHTLGQGALIPELAPGEPIYAVTPALDSVHGAYVSAGPGLCAPSWNSWFPRWINRGLAQEQCDFVCANAVLCEGINFFAPKEACQSLCIVHLREHAVAPPGWTLHKGFLGFLHSVIARPMERTECWAKVPPHGAGSLCAVNTEKNCAVDEDCGKDAGCLKGRCFCSRGCFHDRYKLCLPWSDLRWKPYVETEAPVTTTTTTTTTAVVIEEPTAVCNLGEELKEAGIINSADEFQPQDAAIAPVPAPAAKKLEKTSPQVDVAPVVANETPSLSVAPTVPASDTLAP